MSYRSLGKVIKQVISWLNDNKIPYALIGGLAVSFRTIERATKDIDLAIVVTDDSEAEHIVRSFQTIGFHAETLIEHSVHKVIATVRLLSDLHEGVYVDLLFASSGIEKEIVQSSDPIELLQGLTVNIASLSSLIAMKVLSGDIKKRPRDIFDLENLIKEASAEDIAEAQRLLLLIQSRGYSRKKNLPKLFQTFLKRFSV